MKIEGSLAMGSQWALVVLACLCLLVPNVAMGQLYKDPRQPVERRVNDLLSRMTLDEKIGQMTQIERGSASAAVIQQYKIGSVLSGGGSEPAFRATPSQWMSMTNNFQWGALKTRLSIPFLYGTDAVHGNNNVYGATIFPHNIGLGCTRDPWLVRRIGSATALEVRATGISYTFAPCLAVCRDPRWGRCYESYSEDPEVVRSMTTIIDGLQGQSPAGWRGPYLQDRRKVLACAKHFVGDGGTFQGKDMGNTVVNYETLVKTHMRAYPTAIAKGVSTIMVSYSSWNNQKMHANKFLLTDVLKGRLGFKGFVISDWDGIERITNPWGANYANSVRLGINAGIDMVMVPKNYVTFIATVKRLVSTGAIPMSRINDAVTRILRVKLQAGLFEYPYADNSLGAYLGTLSHRALAREAVRKSLVLLKNGGGAKKRLLPLNKNARRVLVVGAHANDIGLQCGGWTMSWQGSQGATTKGTTILAGIRQSVSKNTEVVYQYNPPTGYAKGKGFEYAIVVVGEKPYAEIQGDNLNNLNMPSPYPALIKDTCSNIPCVVVMISGRPLVVEPYLGYMNAFVAAWLPGSEGRGVAEVLFGNYEFTGRLSRTWFRNVGQLPMNVGDRYYNPLFPFGFGMKMGIK
ncbi:hypothetical protein KC19_10G064500 [Ceratodon purpureus]|uniref:beta-glucosidase n=1 Tax=Ceratodon purpureus TaxID=3225 RepID=A0A8T0GIV7_CERPU|nr:hypothetical protein KC19_10G064500 [Ceratodon purpureus]KAG0558920.1 hypothetical protein KC19_10G064500 [Ceratodon purpureus]